MASHRERKTNITLDRVMNDVLAVINPQQGDWAIRFQVIDELRRVVESVESLRGATVEPFGSFVSNLFTTSGDLDISIQLSNGTYITFAGKKHKQKLLGDLLGALRKAGCRKLQFVQSAKVPILKFESNYHRISCDISVDNLQGQIKSKFLLWLGKIDGRFRDMVLLVKEWAKAHDINNPKFGTFNSYTLSLLVIFHFQTCTPPIFPPLRHIYPGNAVNDLKGVRADAEKQIAETCAANIDRFTSNRSRPPNGNPLSELFVSFLAKFSGITAKAAELGICPYTGKWERLCSNTRWMPKTYAMFVEDPFEQPENTARTVSSRQLARISQVIEFSYHSLIKSNQNPTSVLALLARPQVTQHLMSAPPSRNEHHTGGNHHPPAHRGSRSMQQQKKIGFDNPAPISSAIVNNHSPMQQNPQGSSSQKNRSRHAARNDVKPQQTKKQEQNQPVMPSDGKPQQTTKQDQNQQRKIWRPRSETDK